MKVIEWKYFFIKRKYILSKFATLQQPYKPTANCFFLRQTRLLYPAVLAKYASHMTYQEVFSSLSQSSLRAGSLVWVGNCGQRRQRQARTGEAGEKNKARKVTFFLAPFFSPAFAGDALSKQVSPLAFWTIQPNRLEMLEKVRNSQLKSLARIYFPASWISFVEQMFCGTPPTQICKTLCKQWGPILLERYC